jgi:hypothetical protein
MENEEMIRRRMAETRESLTEKLETLENRLLGSVDEATSAVRETVASVKETMHDGVESVKDAVDVQAHVQRRPWLMFGGAILGGYVAATLLRRETEADRKEIVPPPAPTPPKRHGAGNGHHKPAPKPEAVAEAPSFLKGIEPEINHLKGLALGVTFGTFRELLTKEVPPHLADELRSIIDGVTRKVGGEPIAPGDLPFVAAPTGATETESSSFDPEKPRW